MLLFIALGVSAEGNDNNELFNHHPISEALSRLLENGDYDDAKNAVRGYSVEELAALPDSILFEYYYLKGMIYHDEGNEIQKKNYLIAAKDLCEKSLGIHSSVYLELCWGLGDSYINLGDTVSAFETYQAALIQSIGLYNLDDETNYLLYKDIEEHVREWYRNDEIRKEMVEHRQKLKPRDAGKDAVQYDMEFYSLFFKDDVAKDYFEKAKASSYEEAAEIYRMLSRQTVDNPIAKATLNEFAAECYLNLEDFQSAEPLLLENLSILESHEGSKIYRTTLSQLANLYTGIHNYSKARNFLVEAKYLYEEALDFSRGYVSCLHRSANLERGNQNYWLALLMEDVALQELYKNQTFGIISGSPVSRERFLANGLSTSALNYNQFEFYNEAFMQLEEAINIAETYGLDASTYYGNMASLCFATKNYDRMVGTLENAYSLTESVREKAEIGTILCLSQFLAFHQASPQIIKESSNHLNNLIKYTFSFTSLEERRNFWSYFVYHFPMLNLLAYESEDKSLYGQIYDNILLEKGLLLRTANNLRSGILAKGDDEDLALYDRMLELKKKVLSASPDEVAPLNDEIERIDKRLTQKYSSYENFLRLFSSTWKDIQLNLKDNEIAIEFYNIPEVIWRDNDLNADGKPRCCAVTLKKDYSEPHIIPLCLEENLRTVTSSQFNNFKNLYDLIWSPLQEELNDIDNIYFAAYGDLHKLGIEYAMMADDTMIGDQYNLYRLSTTGVLSEERRENKKDKAVLYGGLNYDMKLDDLVAESRGSFYHVDSAPRALFDEKLRIGFGYLPGTLKEVTEISGFFKEISLVTGNSGTEESFKALEESPVDIIHLATHGFFWTDEDAEDYSDVSFLKLKNERTSSEDWSLIRSGLILSGANIGLKGGSLPDDVEDGVLTALELSNMNLGHVDMVVMSACESGLGETSGEGVFGLQRGFKLAGANTLLMSLWKVDDDATQLLMTEFYKNYLSGKSKQESLRLTQKTLRSNPEYSDPQYWAAFILLDALN